MPCGWWLGTQTVWPVQNWGMISNHIVKWTDWYSHTRSLYWIVHLKSLEKADPGAPVLSPRQKAQCGLESGTLSYSSSIARRHQGQGKRRRQQPTQLHENSLTQSPSQHKTCNIILYPKKIYLSILLEPRKDNIYYKNTNIPLSPTLYSGIC